MKIASKIFTIFFSIIALFIITLFLIIMYSKYIKKLDYPIILGHTYMQVKTESMYPALKANDIVIISLSSSYKEGDIVTYKDKNSFITHRINEKGNNYVVTRGDLIDNNVINTEYEYIVVK